MQDLIKRYFWALGGIVVVVCAVFAAKATTHIIEAKLLGDAEHGPKITAIAPHLEAPLTPIRSKDGTQLAARDMFCADCTVTVDVAKASDPSQILTTSLPLALLATNIGPKIEESYATIINTENQRQGAYSVGEVVPGATNTGKIRSIHFKYVEFENAGRVERLLLQGAPPPVIAAVEPPPALPDENKDDMQASVDSGIKKLDETNYEIDKALVEKVLLNPMAIAKGARVVPSMKNGKPDGFKLYAIRPSSAFAKLGLTNGDTLQSINGFELTSADKALEVYTKLREATSLEVEGTRRGKTFTLKYTIK